MKNMKISHAILLVAMVPILVAAFFSAQVIWNENRTVQGLDKLSSLTEFTVILSNLVHEQQKERGATAVFLGSGGTKFRQEVDAQRRQTNQKREAMESFLETFDAENFDT